MHKEDKNLAKVSEPERSDADNLVQALSCPPVAYWSRTSGNAQSRRMQGRRQASKELIDNQDRKKYNDVNDNDDLPFCLFLPCFPSLPDLFGPNA